ncbi:protein claret segregational [Contarinia nasturtii]|uniref:protein claret segregational n=1 Tax=Contarinia nasturtii TaxID=265458 RepID=UPI0012D3D22D|nr:protein claret segregational [Contarinia nasturtii]
MEGKSRLPTMIKKPTIRAHVPSDRLVSKLANRTALSSFENVINNLRNGTNTTSRPTKRHASPEAFRPKSQINEAKKLRRSRSVSDIDAVMNLVNVQKRAVKGLHAFTMPLAPAPKVKVPYAPPKSVNKPATKPSSVVKPKTQPAHKRLVLNSNPSKTAAKKENVPTKSTGGSSSNVGGNKKIPAYDFKARFHDLQDKHKVLKDKHDRLKEQLGEFESLPEQYDECREKLSNLESEYKSMQKQLRTLQQQKDADQLKINTLNDDLNAKIEECRTLIEAKQKITEKYNTVSIENNELKSNNTELETKLKSQQEMIEHLTTELKEAGEQLFRANIDRKELHNKVMDLQGNIRVFCRVRPPLDGEENRTICSWQYNDETSLEIASEVNKKPVKHEFNFDQVFRPNSIQEDIFELVSPLIQSALDGYNVCIFAYGQTGSGKTFTMDGTESMPGIIPRTIDLLFDCFQQNKRLGWEYTLHASSLEIYNEVLFDLLSNEAKDLDIRMVSAKTPTEIFVQNLADCEVRNKDELHRLIEFAKANRATAATAGNERSSRSHSVTQLRLFGEHKGKNEMTVSLINLIDLAGSESPKTSVRMEETKKINKSLSELTNVIMALLQKQDHIPYRNSKLTHLLMPSLGGNSKTLMFVNASPFQDCFVETVKSLRFAASVNSCKMTKAKKNKIYPTPFSTNSSLNGSN